MDNNNSRNDGEFYKLLFDQPNKSKNEKEGFINYKIENISNLNKCPKNLICSTSKLNFRPIHDNLPASQLTKMDSKERRQLRNKISARKFRDKRKGFLFKKKK